MNYKTTLIIILLLIVIAATYFLLLDEPIEDSPSSKKPTISETYELPREEISKFQLSYADDSYQTISVAKDGGGMWQITSPFAADADLTKVNTVLDDFVDKRIRQVLEVSEYDQYGLERPTITVQLWKDRDDNPITFFVGKKGINYSVYIKEQSEQHIFIIESSALDDLAISTTDIRSRSVISFNPDAITEIEFQKPEPITCVKKGDSWLMTNPISANADSDDIRYILSELQTMQVSSFELDGESAKSSLAVYGLDTPRIYITLKDTKKSYGLLIGSAVPLSTDMQNSDKKTVYVKSIHQGGIYTVADDILKFLNRTSFDLRDKRLLDFQRGDVTNFEIQYGAETIEGIKRQKDLWEIQGNKSITADPQAVSDLIYGVDSLEAVAYVTKSTRNLELYGLKNAQFNIRFTIRDDLKPIELHIGDFAKNDTVFVKTNRSDQIARVKRNLIDKIREGVAWLRDKQIFKFTVDDPIRCTVKYVEDSNDIVQFTCQRLGTNWRLTEPFQENAKNAEVNALLYALIDLKAEEFVGLTFDGKKNQLTDTIKRLESPNLQFIVELRNEAVFTLQVGETDSSGNYYARTQNQPEHVFLLKSELIPKLKPKLEWLRASEEQ